MDACAKARLDAERMAKPKTAILPVYPRDTKCRVWDGRGAESYVFVLLHEEEKDECRDG